jgi:hypothetical protein
VGSPRRRNQRRDLHSPEALADRLPAGLRTFPPITDSQGFAIRARQIAEWLAPNLRVWATRHRR